MNYVFITFEPSDLICNWEIAAWCDFSKSLYILHLQQEDVKTKQNTLLIKHNSGSLLMITAAQILVTWKEWASVHWPFS